MLKDFDSKKLLISSSIVTVIILFLEYYKNKKKVALSINENFNEYSNEVFSVLERYYQLNSNINELNNNINFRYFHYMIEISNCKHFLSNQIVSYIFFLKNKNKIIKKEINKIKKPWFSIFKKEKNENIIQIKRRSIEENKDIIRNLRKINDIKDLIQGNPVQQQENSADQQELYANLFRFIILSRNERNLNNERDNN